MDGHIRLSKVVPQLGVTRKVVYYWARHGLLPGCFNLNGVWLIHQETFELFLKQKRLEWSGSTKDPTPRTGMPKLKVQTESQSGSPLEFREAQKLASRLEKLRKLDEAS